MQRAASAVVVLFLLAAPLFADEATLVTARQLDDEGKFAEAAAAYAAVVATPECPYEAHVRYQATTLQSGGSRDDLVARYDELAKGAPASLTAKLHRLRLDPAEDRIKALGDLKQGPDDALNVMIELGRAYLEAGESKRAAGVLKTAYRAAPPNRPDVARLTAEAYFDEDDIEDAIEVLDEVVARDKGLQNAWVQLGRYRLAAGNSRGAMDAAATALAIRPTHLAALLLLAEAQRAEGDAPAALATLATAQRVNPENPDALVATGDLLTSEGTPESFEKALPVYQQVLEKHPEHVAALHGLGWVLERLQKYEEAIDAYQRMADLRPDDPMPVNSVGVCLFKLGKVSKAQSQFKKAADLDKKFVPALANLGMTYDAQAHYGEAIKIYQKILRMREERDNLRVLVACAFDHETVGAFSKAAKLLEKAHEAAPKNADICVWLADNYFFQEKWKNAEEWYQKAIELNEKAFFAWRGLGYTLAERRRFDDAIKALETASTLNAEDPGVMLVLGDLYLDEQEDIDKALGAYRAYVARGGQDPAVPDLIAELEERAK